MEVKSYGGLTAGVHSHTLQMEQVTLSCQFPHKMNERNSEACFTGSKLFSAFLHTLGTEFL